MEHILSLSYGKDSLACLGAIEELGWPLDRIVHAEVWATDTIPADLPPMVEFKAKADAIIKERWGIEVEHVCAETTYERSFYLKVAALDKIRKKNFEDDVIYKIRTRGNRAGEIIGWPMIRAGGDCQRVLKVSAINAIAGSAIQYLGIAADEPNRFGQLCEEKKSPLVEAGWTEAMCREWCEENHLLSPIYTTATRGGCWFCHNQPVGQLRLLRRNYPEYWALMLKWDKDSPVTFKADGHTVHDFERRFQAEDQGLISPDDKIFRWAMLNEELNYRFF